MTTTAQSAAAPAAAEPFISVYEFSRRTGLAVTRIYERLLSGQIRGSKRGSLWRIPESECVLWVERRKGKRRGAVGPSARAVGTIKRMRREGATLAAIAEKFGISESGVSRIVNGSRRLAEGGSHGA